MVCSKCGKTLPDGTKFCQQCGTKLEVAAEVVKAEVAEAAAEVKAEAVAQAAEVKAETVAAAAEVKAETVAAANEVKAETVAAANEVKAEAVAAATEVKNETVAAAEEVKKEATETAQEVKAAVENATPEEKAEKPEGSKIDFKKFLIPGIAVVAVIVLICLVASLFKGGSNGTFTAGKNSIVNILDDDGSAIAIYGSAEFVDLKVEKKGNVYYNASQNVAAFLNDSKELVIVKDKKVIETGYDDVNYIVMSASGDTLAYLSEVKNGEGTLFLLDIKSKKAKEIADDVRVGTVVLSPNGKTVAFVGDYDDAENFKGYYSVNGKDPVEVGKEKRVFAIADKAAYIYYQDGDRIYVQKGKKDGEKLATDISSVSAYFNADLSQMIYTNDGKSYITDNGKEKVKLSNDEMYGLVDTRNDVSFSYSAGNCSVEVYGVKEFAKQLIQTGSDIAYVKPSFETVKVASNVGEYYLSENGKKLLFVGSKEEVISVTDFAAGGKKTELTNDAEVKSFYTDKDCKYVYFVNKDKELHYINGKKTKKVGDDITDVTISVDGSICYFVEENETLYYTKKGSKKEKVKESDSISCITLLEKTIANVREDDTSTFYIVNKKSLKEVYKYER